MISVVIPLYNKAKHIERTINTVLNQTYTDFELIVVDDGSTDDSADIVSRINDRRIKLIRKENEGVSVTRNKGVELAHCDLVAFLDADDEWEPDFLMSIIELSNLYPEAGLYATNYSVVERNGEKYSLDYPEVPARGGFGLIKNYFRSAMEYTPICSSAVCIRRSSFDMCGGFPVKVKNGEDLELWCRVALKYKVAYVNKPLATYRRDSENMFSRSITDPCLFPFLEEYSPEKADIIEDNDSIWKYISKRQLEAVSASLFVIRNKRIAKEILNDIKYSSYNKNKVIAFRLLSLLPQFAIDKIYKVRLRKIKQYD